MTTVALVAEQLTARRAGKISDKQLAAWAFERFYAVEAGTEELDPHDAEVIGIILDELMFCDDPHFALDDSMLQQLLTRLTTS